MAARFKTDIFSLLHGVFEGEFLTGLPGLLELVLGTFETDLRVLSLGVAPA